MKLSKNKFNQQKNKIIIFSLKILALFLILDSGKTEPTKYNGCSNELSGHRRSEKQKQITHTKDNFILRGHLPCKVEKEKQRHRKLTNWFKPGLLF